MACGKHYHRRHNRQTTTQFHSNTNSHSPTPVKGPKQYRHTDSQRARRAQRVSVPKKSPRSRRTEMPMWVSVPKRQTHGHGVSTVDQGEGRRAEEGDEQVV